MFGLKLKTGFAQSGAAGGRKILFFILSPRKIQEANVHELFLRHENSAWRSLEHWRRTRGCYSWTNRSPRWMP